MSCVYTSSHIQFSYLEAVDPHPRNWPKKSPLCDLMFLKFWRTTYTILLMSFASELSMQWENGAHSQWIIRERFSIALPSAFPWKQSENMAYTYSTLLDVDATNPQDNALLLRSLVNTSPPERPSLGTNLRQTAGKNSTISSRLSWNWVVKYGIEGLRT